MSFNPNSKAGKALIAEALLSVALEQQLDPDTKDSAQRIINAIPKPQVMWRKCLLSTCHNQTTHNGGCCCAEHRKLRDKELKASRTGREAHDA